MRFGFGSAMSLVLTMATSACGVAQHDGARGEIPPTWVQVEDEDTGVTFSLPESVEPTDQSGPAGSGRTYMSPAGAAALAIGVAIIDEQDRPLRRWAEAVGESMESTGIVSRLAHHPIGDDDAYDYWAAVELGPHYVLKWRLTATACNGHGVLLQTGGTSEEFDKSEILETHELLRNSLLC